MLQPIDLLALLDRRLSNAKLGRILDRVIQDREREVVSALRQRAVDEAGGICEADFLCEHCRLLKKCAALCAAHEG